MAGFCKADYVKMPEGISTKRFLLGEDALLRLPEFFRQEFPGKTPWIVADDNTWRVAGEKAFQLFQNDGLNPAEPFVYPGTPRLHPVYAEALLLAKRMPENAIPVAVGSGVINDMVKCVGSANNVPYLCGIDLSRLSAALRCERRRDSASLADADADWHYAEVRVCHMCARDISAREQKSVYPLGNETAVRNGVAVLLLEVFLTARLIKS